MMTCLSDMMMTAEELLHQYYSNRSLGRSDDRLQILRSKHAICESEIELFKFRQKNGESDKLSERLKINNEVMKSMEIAEGMFSELDSLVFFNRRLLNEISHLKAEVARQKELIEFNK